METPKCAFLALLISLLYHLTLAHRYSSYIHEKKPVDQNHPLVQQLSLSTVSKVDHWLESIYEHYDASIRPNVGGPPLCVSVMIEVFDIVDISESNMEFTSDISVTQRWNDPRLARKIDRGRLILSDADAQRTWQPDTQFVNEKREPGHRGQSRLLTQSKGQLVSYSDGTLEHLCRLTVTAYCHMNIRLFPHDTQNCSLTIASGFYSVTDLIFNASGSDVIILCPDLHEFKVQNTEVISTTYPSQGMNFSRLEFHLELQRKIGHYLIQIYFPTIAMVILSWLVFWFPNVATAHRFVVGFATMINLSMVAANLNARLPNVGYVKALDVFCFGCFIFVFLALCESLLVANSSRIPEYRFGSGDIEYEAPLALLPKKLDCEDDDSYRRLRRLFPFDSVDKASRLLFPVAFLIFVIVYWICVNVVLQ